MKNRQIVAILFFALSIPALAVVSVASDSAESHHLGVTVEAFGLFMTRTQGDTFSLVSTASHPGTGDILSSSAMALNKWKPGIELGIGLTCGRLGGEIRGFMLSKVSNSAMYANSVFQSINVETDPITNYNLPDNSSLTGNNEGTLYGLEANLTYDLSSAIRLYGGLYYRSLTEKFSLHGVWGSGGEDEVWDTRNQLWGGQAGVRADLMALFQASSSGVILQGQFAFALSSNSALANFAKLKSLTRFCTASAKHISPALQAGLRFGYRFGQSFELFGGYNLLWMNSVAKAVDQVAGTTSFYYIPTSTLVLGQVLYHGGNVGLALHF